MKVKENRIINNNVVQIYLTEEEKNSEEIQKEIEKIKETNKNIVLFVSGNKETKDTLKEMVNTIKNISSENY